MAKCLGVEKGENTIADVIDNVHEQITVLPDKYEAVILEVDVAGPRLREELLKVRGVFHQGAGFAGEQAVVHDELDDRISRNG